MRIVPFGKQKGQNGGFYALADQFEMPGMNKADESTEAATVPETQPVEKSKIDEVQEAIVNVVGDPSLDNLMIILAAIGMSQIKFAIAEDGSSLSVSGVIKFTDPEEKIGKKE